MNLVFAQQMNILGNPDFNDVMKKLPEITVVGWTYPPDLSARGFKTYELVKELVRKGFRVNLIVYCQSNKTPNLEQVTMYSLRIRSEEQNHAGQKFYKLSHYPRLHRAVQYFRGQYFLLQAQRITRLLQVIVAQGEQQLIISIGLPMTTHIGVANFFRTIGKKQIPWVADFGDPHYGNDTMPIAPFHKWCERYILRQADVITCPTGPMKDLFQTTYRNIPVLVMPQGVALEDFPTADYNPSHMPVFGYAGTFYVDHRWPEFFFEELLKVSRPFKFIIYAPFGTHPSARLLKNKFEAKMRGRVEFREALPRREVIFELSKMDFLISFKSRGNVQQPSKIIDYTLAKRPYISIDQAKPDFTRFHKFLALDFSDFQELPVEQFDIRTLTDKLLRRINIDLPLNSGKAE